MNARTGCRGPAGVTPNGRNNKQCREPFDGTPTSPSGTAFLYNSNYHTTYYPVYGYMS
jgi:hypothetical protein